MFSRHHLFQARSISVVSVMKCNLVTTYKLQSVRDNTSSAFLHCTLQLIVRPNCIGSTFQNVSIVQCKSILISCFPGFPSVSYLQVVLHFCVNLFLYCVNSVCFYKSPFISPPLLGISLFNSDSNFCLIISVV